MTFELLYNVITLVDYPFKQFYIYSGIFGAPMKEVSQCAVNAIMRFLQGPYSTYMESIHLVDIHDSTLQQFVTDLKKIKELKVIEEQ